MCCCRLLVAARQDPRATIVIRCGIHAHVYTHADAHVYTHADTHADTHFDTHVYPRIDTHIDTNVVANVDTNVDAYVYATHVHTHVCTHVYTREARACVDGMSRVGGGTFTPAGVCGLCSGICSGGLRVLGSDQHDG